MENRGGGDCTPRGNVCLGMTGRFAPAADGYRNFNCDLGDPAPKPDTNFC